MVVVYEKPAGSAVRATDTTTLMSDVCPDDKALGVVKVAVPLYVTVIPVGGLVVVVTVYVNPVPPTFLTQMYPFAEPPCAMLPHAMAAGVSLYGDAVEQVGCELGGAKVIPCMFFVNVTVPELLTVSCVAAYAT